MSNFRQSRQWLRNGLMVTLQLALLARASGTEANVPVDVPDEFGLGERLALVAWLHDHHIAVADPANLPALRSAYLDKAHPNLAGAQSEQQRSDVAAELYRRFGRNPPNGASTDDITALITSLEEAEKQALARDQALAAADSQNNQTPPAASAQPEAPPRTRSAPAHPPAVAAPEPSDDRTVDESDWLQNLEEAQALAKKTGRPILADFTGSDWCIWCKRLHTEVFDTPRFKSWAKDHVVLLLVDFPKKTPQAPDIAAQNAQLAKQFAIHGYPTVVVLDPSGKKLGTQGYEKGGPDKWITDISKLIDN